jgi:nucleoside-diphosphate kinase
MEKILVLVKPDGIQRGLVGEVTTRLERKGLKLIGLKLMQLDDAVLNAHYAHIVDKPFYADINEFMKSSPVVAMAWEGLGAAESVRVLVGPTHAGEAAAGTIRGDFGLTRGRNIVHASDSAENGAIEVERFFTIDEIFSYDKSEYQHVYAPDER